MTSKSRIERLEQAIKPKGVEPEIFKTTDYKDQAEMDQAVEKWDRDHPGKSCNEQFRHIFMHMGFKDWVWDYWEREFISPGEMKMRKQEMYPQYGEGYGEEAGQWGEGYIEGKFKEKDREYIKNN